MRPSKRFLALTVLVAAGAAACANGDASGNQAREAMENAGLTSLQATCVGNRLEQELPDQGDLNAVSKAGDLTTLAGVEVRGRTEDLYEITLEVMETCIDDPEVETPDEGPETEQAPSADE